MNGGRRDESGMAFLFVIVFLGAVSMLGTVMLARIVPREAFHRGQIEANLATVRLAAERAFVQSGDFPRDLDALAMSALLERDGWWRRDPWRGTDLWLRVRGRPRTMTVTSYGPDRRRGTATDNSAMVLQADGPLRQRTINRLRVLRARFVQWQLAAASLLGRPMSPGDAANLRSLTNEYARELRRRLFVDDAERLVIAGRLQQITLDVQALRTAYGVSVPQSVRGSNGLMLAFGMSDERARDGQGRFLVYDEVVGCVSQGGDRRTGTIDDF